ncbi:hypothetical protein L3X38_016822 [Prunus dulcis]|uniref:Uncharacterized protein n=1 Tax=Prunus dulcis TaxID=3755 RepID=A0AAD4Z9H1_PRUDU|nr:hypothetical protein L3X38_016822 [Prunus dulcis]
MRWVVVGIGVYAKRSPKVYGSVPVQIEWSVGKGLSRLAWPRVESDTCGGILVVDSTWVSVFCLTNCCAYTVSVFCLTYCHAHKVSVFCLIYSRAHRVSVFYYVPYFLGFALVFPL